MWHIIPPAKLTGAYFRRLSYNVGVSQRLRAEIHRRLPKTFVLEIAKWAATLVFCCTMPPRKSRWLLRMRLEISRPKAKTGKCMNCKPYCHITTGFSGAGAFSDGKFNLGTAYGGTLGDSEFSGRKLVVIPVCAAVLNTKG